MTNESERTGKANENPLFLGLIGNLQVSAMVHLGKLTDPNSGETERNLSAAKATIDLLRMLREKTRGNLSNGERTLLDHAIFELELNYVEESGRDEHDSTTEETDAEDAEVDDRSEEPDQNPG
jgi:hypothetical protein